MNIEVYEYKYKKLLWNICNNLFKCINICFNVSAYETLAFFWLVSLLLSSLVWFITVQISNKNSAAQQRGLLIFGVVLSVLLQETFRYGYYRLLKKANEGLLALSQEDTMPISMRQLAYVSGLGFGFMSGAFSVVNILSDSLGPGTIGIHGDSQHYFISSAFMTLAIILLHMFWGVVFFESCERQRWWALGAVVISHLVVSCLKPGVGGSKNSNKYRYSCKTIS
uniref:Gamma-secretase subunit APH-1 n=1 Tax=Sinocyclocheilus grahami TaxID=75366 RepID=A0A672MRE7_SINGR